MPFASLHVDGVAAVAPPPPTLPTVNAAIAAMATTETASNPLLPLTEIPLFVDVDCRREPLPASLHRRGFRSVTNRPLSREDEAHALVHRAQGGRRRLAGLLGADGQQSCELSRVAADLGVPRL